VAAAPGGRPGSPAHRRLRSRPPAAPARSVPRVCLHPAPIPSPLLHSHLRTQPAWLPLSTFLLLALPASPRSCGHIPTSSTPPSHRLQLLCSPLPGPCHYHTTTPSLLLADSGAPSHSHPIPPVCPECTHGTPSPPCPLPPSTLPSPLARTPPARPFFAAMLCPFSSQHVLPLSAAPLFLPVHQMSAGQQIRWPGWQWRVGTGGHISRLGLGWGVATEGVHDGRKCWFSMAARLHGRKCRNLVAVCACCCGGCGGNTDIGIKARSD